MNECWPPCSPFCECVDGDCRPSIVQINAVRLRMTDGRYLVAIGGGGAALVASTGSYPPYRTFRFVPPASWPFVSGDPFALAVCDSNWNASTNLVRVYHTEIRSGVGIDASVSYVLGGEDGGVFVNAGFSAGYPAYSGSDPLETEFSIVKLGGGTISHGDTVFIRIAQNRTDFGPVFFRVNPPLVNPSGFVVGDGDDPAALGFGQATPFIVEFLEVKGGGVGPRPDPVVCRRCATVWVTVKDAGNHNPLPRASVKASGSLANQPFVLAARPFGNGEFLFANRLRSGVREVCVPEGEISLSVTEDRHESFLGPVSVPATGGITVPIELVCTKVSGTVVNSSGAPVTDAVVYLVDSLGATYQRDVNPADGSFTFECVQHGNVSVSSDDRNGQTFAVPPEGKRNVILTELTQSADIEGYATDVQGGLPIEDVTVWVVGRMGTVSTNTSGYYRIVGVAAGQHGVAAKKVGYQQLPLFPMPLPNTVVPGTGTVRQDLQLRRTPRMLEVWNTGVDSSHAQLMPGASDPHWFVVNGPGIAARQNAIVLANPAGAYTSPMDSRWIWVTANGIGGGPGDLFTFQLQFDLTGFDPTSVVIEGAWSVDNNGAITLNGSSPVGTGTFSLAGAASGNYDSAHVFTISDGFVAGMNRLEVQMANVGTPSAINPAGLNVTRLTITGTALP